MEVSYATIKPSKDKKIEEFSSNEWLWLYENKCSHGHRYSAHMKCYFNEEQVPEKVSGLDIEASGLDADFGVMLAWCIKPVGEKINYDCLTLEDIDKGQQDARIVETLVDEL